MWQKMMKSLVRLASNPFLMDTRNLRIGYSFCHYCEMPRGFKFQLIPFSALKARPYFLRKGFSPYFNKFPKGILELLHFYLQGAPHG